MLRSICKNSIQSSNRRFHSTLMNNNISSSFKKNQSLYLSSKINTNSNFRSIQTQQQSKQLQRQQQRCFSNSSFLKQAKKGKSGGGKQKKKPVVYEDSDSSYVRHEADGDFSIPVDIPESELQPVRNILPHRMRAPSPGDLAKAAKWINALDRKQLAPNNVRSQYLLRIITEGTWHVVSSAKEGCVLAFSSIDKLREFAPAVPDQATKAMDGAHLFASLSTNEELQFIAFDPENPEAVEPIIDPELHPLVLHWADTVLFEKFLLTIQVKPGEKMSQEELSKIDPQQLQFMWQRTLCLGMAPETSSEDPEKAGIMCDENNRIVVAVSLDHVAELSREGNIQPMQVSTQELFEIVEAENTGVMFIVGGDIGDANAEGTHEVQHESIAFDNTQAIDILSMCRAANNAVRLLDSVSPEQREALEQALKESPDGLERIVKRIEQEQQSPK